MREYIVNCPEKYKDSRVVRLTTKKEGEDERAVAIFWANADGVELTPSVIADMLQEAYRLGRDEREWEMRHAEETTNKPSGGCDARHPTKE